MKFILLVKSNPVTEAGGEGPEGLVEAMTRYNNDLAAKGVLLDAVGLYPSAQGGVRLRDVGSGEAAVVEGPFPDPAQIVAGYTIIQARDRDEAVEWARRMPRIAQAGDPFEVEVRQLY